MLEAKARERGWKWRGNGEGGAVGIRAEEREAHRSSKIVRRSLEEGRPVPKIIKSADVFPIAEAENSIPRSPYP